MKDTTQTTKRKKRKKGLITLRFRKDDPTHNLLAATQHWIKANGGSAIVIGGIGLLREGEFKYRVCVGAMGRCPEKEPKNAD